MNDGMKRAEEAALRFLSYAALDKVPRGDPRGKKASQDFIRRNKVITQRFSLWVNTQDEEKPFCEPGAHHVVVVPGQHRDAAAALPVPDPHRLVVTT